MTILYITTSITVYTTCHVPDFVGSTYRKPSIVTIPWKFNEVILLLQT